MVSPMGERAAADAIYYGRAILKFISANDTGVTGSHQAGFHLPLAAWKMLTPQPPTHGVNDTHLVNIVWPDGRNTESAVKWYGRRTRYEYRLTRFGRDFPWLTEDNVGSLLVLIPCDVKNFLAYVLDEEDDIEGVKASLGVESLEKPTVFEAGVEPQPEDENQCVQRLFREFVQTLNDFPQTREFSETTWEVLLKCVQNFLKRTADKQLVDARDAEYELFMMVERYLCGPEVQRMFKSIDDFLKTAMSIMNRRKARAGRSLEHHVERLLAHAKVEFERQPRIDGLPDIVIPNADAYRDPTYPDNRLMVLGIKTTCKDRWRQVLNEASRIREKHILTLQPGISRNQLSEMKQAGIKLIVPKGLHRMYHPDSRSELMTVESFIQSVQNLPC